MQDDPNLVAAVSPTVAAYSISNSGSAQLTIVGTTVSILGANPITNTGTGASGPGITNATLTINNDNTQFAASGGSTPALIGTVYANVNNSADGVVTINGGQIQMGVYNNSTGAVTNVFGDAYGNAGSISGSTFNNSGGATVNVNTNGVGFLLRHWSRDV